MNQSIETIAVEVSEELDELSSVLPSVPGQILEAMRSSAADGSLEWHALQFGVALLFLAAGYVAALPVRTWGRRQLETLFESEPNERTEKLFYLLSRALVQVLQVAVMFAVAGALAMLFQQTQVQRADFLAVIFAVTAFMLGRALFLNLMASGMPACQVMPFNEAAASGLGRELALLFGIGYAFSAVQWWLVEINLGEEARQTLQVLISLLFVFLLSLVAYRYRRDIARAFRIGRDTVDSKWLQFITDSWYVFAIAYFTVAWAIGVGRVLLGLPAAIGLVGAPVLALLFGLMLYGVLLVIIDRLMRKDENEDDSTGHGAALKNVQSPMRPLAEKAAGLLTFAAGAAFVLWRWGVSITADSPVVNMLDIVLVVFGGWFAYQAIEVWINQKIEAEGGIDLAEPGEEGPGASRVSRVAMLLSLFRKFLMVTVMVIVGMIVLSEMGVDVAPLFAGAGIVGLAVGFGAQTLVRDIFSGAFFLMDDAFRLGEYIDVGEVKGTVEKISVRSMQLRHHMGALHTIPFGEITHLTNFSRDWVMMKLKLRVTYDTDIDKVRKLVKKLGQQLLEHPEIGDKFMQPLKSQGVYSMEDDSAIIIRVKFMTKPGDQFQARKVVYNEIRELFEKEGIKFADHREVVVRVAESSSKEATPEVAGAAAAGALVEEPAAEGGTR